MYENSKPIEEKSRWSGTYQDKNYAKIMSPKRKIYANFIIFKIMPPKQNIWNINYIRKQICRNPKYANAKYTEK